MDSVTKGMGKVGGRRFFYPFRLFVIYSLTKKMLQKKKKKRRREKKFVKVYSEITLTVKYHRLLNVITFFLRLGIFMPVTALV